jgi:hypothetical protein
MKAKSFKGKSVEVIKIAFENSMADGFKPILDIMFSSVKELHNLTTCCVVLKQIK